jgi:hypothetical protein
MWPQIEITLTKGGIHLAPTSHSPVAATSELTIPNITSRKAAILTRVTNLNCYIPVTRRSLPLSSQYATGERRRCARPALATKQNTRVLVVSDSASQKPRESIGERGRDGETALLSRWELVYQPHLTREREGGGDACRRLLHLCASASQPLCFSYLKAPICVPPPPNPCAFPT